MATKSSIESGKGHMTLGVDADPLTRGLKAAEDKFKQWGTSIGVIGRNMASVGALGIGSLVPSVGIFATYEQSLANLRAAADPTADQFARLRAQIEQLGRATGTDFGELTAGYSELLKAGLTVNQVLGGMGETLVRFSRVAGMEMSQTATVLVDSLNQFSREGLTASQAANIMNSAADASTISLREVSDAFANGGSVAATFGQTMRDTATAIAIFGNGGIKGAEAGTTLRTLMLRLSTGTEGAAGAIAELGLNVRDSAGNMRPLIDIIGQLDRALVGRSGADRDRLLADLGGAYGIRGLTTLLASGTAGWDRMQQAMDSSLTVEQKFDVMTNTLLGNLKRLWVQVQGIAVAVGESLAPSLGVAMQILTPIMSATADFVRENATAVKVFAAVSAAILAASAAVLVFSGLATGVGIVFGKLAVAAGLAMAAIGWLPTLILWSDYARYSILGLTGVFRMFGVEMRDIWEPLGFIDDLFDSLMGTISGFVSGTMFEEMAQSIRLMWNELLNSPIGEFAKDIALVVIGFLAVQAALAGIAGYVAYFLISSWLEMWLGMVRELWTMIPGLFTLWLEGIGYISQAFRAIFSPLLSLGQRIMDFVGEVYRSAAASFASAWSVTVAEFGRLANGLTETATQTWQGITAAFSTGDWSAIWEIMRASAMLAWAQIMGFIEPTWNTWKDALLDTFSAIWLALRSGFIRLWADVKAYAFNTLADIAAASGLTEQERGFRLSALSAVSQGRNEIALMESADMADWFAQQSLRVERDTAAAAGNAAEVARLQGELDFLSAEADSNRLAAELAGGPSPVGPLGGLRLGGGDMNAQAAGRAMVMGGFGANGMLIQGASVASPEQRAANQRQRQIDLLVEAVAGLVALREEVAPRLT